MRTFLAVDLSKDVRKRLGIVQRSLGSEEFVIRWVAEPLRHITLRFIGDVSDKLAVDICRTARDVVAGASPFQVTVRGVECIGKTEAKVRMIWAGVVDRDDGLGEIYRLLDDSLGQLGVDRERRPYKPHVTLGRVKVCRDGQALRKLASPLAVTDFGSVDVQSITVYESTLTPAGPIYTPMATAPM